jgi:hypothetical protein
MLLTICGAAHRCKHRSGCVDSHTDSCRVDRVHGRAAVAEDESSEESCLHCDINEVVRDYIEGEEQVDIADLAARMAESLVELILFAPEQEQGKLLAAALSHLGHAFLEKSGAIEGGTSTAH